MARKFRVTHDTLHEVFYKEVHLGVTTELIVQRRFFPRNIWSALILKFWSGLGGIWACSLGKGTLWCVLGRWIVFLYDRTWGREGIHACRDHVLFLLLRVLVDNFMIALFLPFHLLLTQSMILVRLSCISAINPSKKGASFHFIGKLAFYFRVDKLFICWLDRLFIDHLRNYCYQGLNGLIS